MNRNSVVGYCAEKMPIQISSLDRLNQGFLINTQLHGKITIQKVSISPGVNEDKDCVRLSIPVEEPDSTTQKNSSVAKKSVLISSEGQTR